MRTGMIIVAAGALLCAAPAWGQAGKVTIKDDAWQRQYDDRLTKWQAAETAYAEVLGRVAKLPGGDIAKATAQLKGDLDKSGKDRALATRELEVFLRRSPLRRRPLLADMYVQRALTTQNGLEASAALAQAEAVLRGGADFFRSAWQAIPSDDTRRAEQRFELRILSIRARKALADHLVDNIIYKAIDEYEVFNQQNAVIKGTVGAIDEVIASYRMAREELDDLVGDSRDNLQRLRIQAEMDGFQDMMKIAAAWQMYYRAWLTPPPRDTKTAAAVQRRKDLEQAFDTFQDNVNNKMASDAAKTASKLGYALVTREQGQASAAADELRKLASAAELTGTKVQATWELARTLFTMRRYEDAISQCDALDKMEMDARARDKEIENALISKKDPPEGYPGRFYTRVSPAMRLNILYVWKNSRESPTKGKAEALFQKAAESLKNRDDANLWAMIVDSMNNRRWKEIVKDPDNPKPDEIAQLTGAEKLMLGRQYLNDGKVDTAKLYLTAVLADTGYINDPANKGKSPDIQFELAAIEFQLYDREKKAAGADNKPTTTHIVAALEMIRRLSKEYPDHEVGKKAFASIPAVMKEIVTTFPEDAKGILEGRQMELLEEQLKRDPAHPASDGRRLALANEYEAAAERLFKAQSGLSVKDREKSVAEQRSLINKAMARYEEIKPNRPEYTYAQVRIAETKYRDFFREESGSKSKVDAARIRSVAETLRKAGDIALTDWKTWPADKRPKPDQLKRSRALAASYVMGSAELLVRPAVNDLAKADELLLKYEKVFHEGQTPEALAGDWEADDLRVRRRAMRIYYLQTTGKAKEAEDLILDFLTKERADITNRYMGKLFSQTRRLIDEAEQKSDPKKALDLSKQLVALGERLLPMLPANEREGPRGLAIRELIVEMQIKSGDVALAQKALDKAEEVLKGDPKNGQWQIFKCESLTRLAYAAGQDKAKWTNVVTEWKKLTADRDMITKPEYNGFFWQSWWYLFSARHEMSLWEPPTEQRKIQQEVRDALKNLIGIYRHPPDAWAGKFDDLRSAFDENASALKFLKR